MSSKNLFGDEGGEVEDTIKINKSYATAYSRWRTAEEMQANKLTAADLEGTDSESSDDEYADPNNPEFDKDFLKVLGALKSKDPMIKDPTKSFWKTSYGNSDGKKQEEKIVNIRDFQRNEIVKKLDQDNYEHNDEEEEEEEVNYLVKDTDVNQNKQSKGFGFTDDNVNDEEDMFEKKKQVDVSKVEPKKNKEVLYDYVKGTTDTLESDEDEPLLKNIKDTWSRKDLDHKDKWLKEFFLNRKYLDEDDDPSTFEKNPVSFSDDEKTFDEHESFAAKYNFRFEEPGALLVHHPRAIKGSLRQKDDSRQKQREEMKTRKKEAMDRKKQELLQLRSEKKKELLLRLKKINETAGADLGYLEEELNSGFDPDQYDEKMKQVFDNEYYQEDGEEDLEKPVFDDDDDDDIYEDYDELLEKRSKGKGKKSKQPNYEDDGNEYYEEDDQMNAGASTSKTKWEQEVKEACGKKKTRSRKSKFVELIEKEKPAFNPEDTTYEKYLDEFYNLDFEDIVGGMPVRFNYNRVEPNNFGLSTYEMLSATSHELNAWYSTKNFLRHDRTKAEEMVDIKVFGKKAKKESFKQKILPSLYEDPEEALKEEVEKRKLKYEKKKARKQRAALRTDRMNTKIAIEEKIEKRRKLRGEKKDVVLDAVQMEEPDAASESIKSEQAAIVEESVPSITDKVSSPKKKKANKHIQKEEDIKEEPVKNDEKTTSKKSKKKKSESTNTEILIEQSHLPEKKIKQDKLTKSTNGETSPSKKVKKESSEAKTKASKKVKKPKMQDSLKDETKTNQIENGHEVVKSTKVSESTAEVSAKSPRKMKSKRKVDQLEQVSTEHKTQNAQPPNKKFKHDKKPQNNFKAPPPKPKAIDPKKAEQMAMEKLAGVRLENFGLDPKKFMKKVKYGMKY